MRGRESHKRILFRYMDCALYFHRPTPIMHILRTHNLEFSTFLPSSSPFSPSSLPTTHTQTHSYFFHLQTLEIPFLKVTKKVKSMQIFRQPVQRASQGDRVGICVTQFDPKQVERCLVCSPGHLPTLYGRSTVVNINHELTYPWFPNQYE